MKIMLTFPAMPNKVFVVMTLVVHQEATMDRTGSTTAPVVVPAAMAISPPMVVVTVVVTMVVTVMVAMDPVKVLLLLAKETGTVPVAMPTTSLVVVNASSAKPRSLKAQAAMVVVAAMVVNVVLALPLVPETGNVLLAVSATLPEEANVSSATLPRKVVPAMVAMAAVTVAAMTTRLTKLHLGAHRIVLHLGIPLLTPQTMLHLGTRLLLLLRLATTLGKRLLLLLRLAMTLGAPPNLHLPKTNLGVATITFRR
jgi:hypothetical protein